MRRRAAFGLALAVAVILFALIRLAPRTDGQEACSGAVDSRPVEERWLSAVAANDVKTALALASEICADLPREAADQECVDLAEKSGIKGAFFDAAFGVWDFQLWAHAHFFRWLADAITGGDQDDIEAIYSATIRRLEPKEGRFPHVPWPYWIWQRGFGVCDRQSWVLCELAYQSGWETQIVYLIDPKTQGSPHTVCELRKGRGRAWFADPLCKILLPHKSVDEVASDPQLLAGMWPDHPELRIAIQHCVFLTPSYPQDCCPRNRQLHGRLVRVLKGRCPRFGTDSRERLDIYRRLQQSGAEGTPQFRMALWQYPFGLLREDMRKRSELRGTAPLWIKGR